MPPEIPKNAQILSALPVYEAVARLGSFTRAAQELSLTQSAVSRRIASLEQSLGVVLFSRRGRAITITEDGLRLAEVAAEALHLMESTRSRLGGATDGLVRIGVLPSLGSLWLAQRIGQFTQRHPGIRLQVVTIAADFSDAHKDPVNWDPSSLDVVLTLGHDGWRSLTIRRLAEESMVPVASPALAAQYPVSSPAGLCGMPRLVHTTRPDAWKGYSQFFSLPPFAESTVQLHFDHFFLVLEAARAGAGLALVPEILLQQDLAAGRLVTVGPRWSTGASYSAVASPAALARPAVALLVQWLCDQAAIRPVS